MAPGFARFFGLALLSEFTLAQPPPIPTATGYNDVPDVDVDKIITDVKGKMQVGGESGALAELNKDVRTYVGILTTVAEGCNTVLTEAQCLKSKDGRPWATNSPCNWCCGDFCTPGGARCEPKVFLDHNGITRTRNPVGKNNCPPEPVTLFEVTGRAEESKQTNVGIYVLAGFAPMAFVGATVAWRRGASPTATEEQELE